MALTGLALEGAAFRILRSSTLKAPLSRPKDFLRPGEELSPCGADKSKGNLTEQAPEPPLLLIPDGHAAGVGVQALALGKIGDAGGYFAQRFPGVVEEAGLFYKVVYAQGA